MRPLFRPWPFSRLWYPATFRAAEWYSSQISCALAKPPINLRRFHNFRGTRSILVTIQQWNSHMLARLTDLSSRKCATRVWQKTFGGLPISHNHLWRTTLAFAADFSQSAASSSGISAASVEPEVQKQEISYHRHEIFCLVALCNPRNPIMESFSRIWRCCFK